MGDRRLQGMLDRALREKYCHSMGAVLDAEGRHDEAVRFFEEALAVDEKAYVRCRLGLSAAAKGDLDRALAEMTRAIELCPRAAEYYYRRSLILRRRGEGGRADADLARAVGLDPNYGRIEAIRDAAARLGEHFPEARGSCMLPCPAYCCHFSHEPVVHGVILGPWKLRAIRLSLKERGLAEEAFLGRLFFREEEHHARLIPPDAIVKEGGMRVVFYPRRGRKPLGERLFRHLPHGRDYEELSWITARARPCAFLDRGRCSVHDLGGEPALPACKEFFCLTGLVFHALSRLGLVRGPDVETKGMDELNRIALEALLTLGEDSSTAEGATRAHDKIRAMIGGGTKETP